MGLFMQRASNQGIAALDELAQHALQFEVFTYNALVGACVKGRMLALRFDEMRQQALVPNLITYNVMICAGKTGRMMGRAALG